MADGGKVTLYLDHVRIRVRNASDKFLEAAALQIEAQTKANIQGNGQIDTGFMLNSTYTVSRSGGSTFQRAQQSGRYPDSQGYAVQRNIVPAQSLPDRASAACVVGAEYAIYQEVRKPFLFPAAETVAGQIGGRAVKVIREHLSDG